jgi:hypothetical protein
MTDEQPPDEPDPIAEAFRTFKKRPKDIVPRKPRADDPPITTGPGGTYHNVETTADGMTREGGTAFIERSIYTREQLRKLREEREREND